MAQIKKKGECSSDQEGKGALSAAWLGLMPTVKRYMVLELNRGFSAPTGALEVGILDLCRSVYFMQ